MKRARPGGTSLQGTIETSYKELVRVFGEPHSTEGYKTDAEWCFEVDKKIFTIYNYKNGVNYLGVNGKVIEDITNWHIGGFDIESVDIVKNLLRNEKKGGFKMKKKKKNKTFS